MTIQEATAVLDAVDTKRNFSVRGLGGGKLGDILLKVVAGLVLLYIFIPIFVIVLFSFNKPAGKFNYTWQGFTLDNWANPFKYPALANALKMSIEVAAVSTAIALVLGTLLAIALVRQRFRGNKAVETFLVLPLTAPEVVMGASLLTLFLDLGWATGFGTILIAHIMFCLSYVVVTVKARIAGLDPRLEQAAADLYANELQTFRRITLPLVAPGIAAGALLAFSLSFDDYIITNFNASNASITFPMYVWGAAARGTPVQINVIGTAMFVLAVLAVALGQMAGRRRTRVH